MHGKMLQFVDSNDIDGRERARKDFENGVNADTEITDLWTDLVSIGRDGTQGDISYSENRRRDGTTNPVFEAERKSDSTRDQGRSDTYHRIDWEEADRIIADLRKMIAELDEEPKGRVNRSRSITGEVQYNYKKLYTLMPEYAKEVAREDREDFNRWLANKTSDMTDGETRNVLVYCGKKVYFLRLMVICMDKCCVPCPVKDQIS